MSRIRSFPELPILALALLAAFGASAGAQQPEPAPVEDPARWALLAAERLPALEVCRPEGAEEDMLCGTLAVWEDREAPAGRKIDLHVIVVPARTAEPLPDPFVPVAGGPGDSVHGWAPWVTQGFPEVVARRDVLLVDQRGTGKSNGLPCAFGVTEANPQPAYEAFFPLDGVKACLAELEQRADLTKYLTSIAVEDMEEVRQWLGYGKLNLLGGSYGTRFVQEFLRRHPESVRTAILHGLAGMDQRMPVDHARDGQRALDMVLLLCEEDPPCREAFPDLREELWTVVNRLEETPGRATLENPLTGEEVTLSVGRGMFAESLRSLLYNPSGAAELPFLVHRAFQGDFAPFFKSTVPYRVFIELDFANGLYLSITCSEDVAWFTEDNALVHDRGSALGDLRTAAQLGACSVWPKTEIPADFREPVETDLPVLIVVGELDPVTPPRFARDAVRHMPNALLVVLPRGHHGFDGLTNQECVEDLLDRFIEQGTTEGLDPSCVTTMQRPPFVLEESGMRYMQQQEEGE
ncbi:MAG TPA: alpha/beta fold hydrolase [Thermoanaerobaculia bacterium]|nr:alpha/beta fold hydrolase [Thermoanaerobaculia bacterium]